MAVLGILGVVGGLLGPAIEVAKLIAAPIGRQCSYLCCLRSNIKTLEDEAKILRDATSDLRKRVDTDENNAQIIFATVNTWLNDSDDKKNETGVISAEAPDVGSGCLNLRKRYSLSRKAKKTANAIKLLVEKCKFTEISHPPPPAASAPVQLGTTTYEFESRRDIEEEILKSLGDKKVHKIGLCGMGGLGKTTMAQMMMNKALREELFDEVTMAVVSKPVKKLDIQLQIGAKLKLTFENDDLFSRASLLRTRLRGNKRVLIVLDDVWERLDMEELGIPCDDGCKVLITSRDNIVLNKMGVKIRELNILDEEEAWVMFRGNAGTCVEDSALKSTAKDVMRECKGLPLALEIVGLTLKDEKDVSEWEGALGQLRRSNPADIPDVIEKVYNHLKLSYDHLDSENAKSLFLLCCLFPEDCDVPMEQLIYFAVGLHVFKDIEDLKEVRVRTRSLIKILKSRGLLLVGSDEDHVRMHDVTRDVSIFIASTERRIKCSDCSWISSHVDGGPRRVPPLPKLKLLLMDNGVEQEMEVGGNLIGESTELNVLFIEWSFMKSLPVHTLQSLKISLATLVLHGCIFLESIAVVEELECLEILICRSCNTIKELPEQARGLKRLKLLEISECEKLRRIAAGVISSLVALEELKIVECFRNWKGGEMHDTEGEGGNEASLREIESLEKLRSLDIQVLDASLAAQPLRLVSPEALVQFRVRFGHEIRDAGDLGEKISCKRKFLIVLSRGNDMNVGDLSTNIFLTRTESLHAHACWLQDFNLSLATAPSIRWLSLVGFDNKKNIASAASAFPLLVFLSLEGMSSLEEIWDTSAPIPSNSFNNLKHLNLERLWALQRMGKCVLSTARNFFLHLETIHIEKCTEMEHLLVLVPDDEQEKKDDIALFLPKLKILRLNELPKLTSICSGGIRRIEFPLLAEMEIVGCRNLKCFVSTEDDDDSSHLLCHPKVSFGNLKKLKLSDNMECKNVWCDEIPVSFFRGVQELEISFYDTIRSLFSSYKIPQNLVSLEKLSIVGCDEMVRVIDGEEDEEVSSSSHHHPTKLSLFPSLQQVTLLGLDKLESFCKRRCALELPSLKILEMGRCDEMKSFNAGGSTVTPSLQAITVYNEKLECVQDLNAALYQQFEKAKREQEEA